ncbi:MAG TPA: FHA domain-containing protein [Vicinamibacterales bacterium]
MKVRFGEFVLHSEAREFRSATGEIHLSPKAFDLLCALLTRRPNVVSKADLFAQIWPDTFVVDANLNVLVGEIRKAIGDDPRSSRFIKTAHGVGYSFCGSATEVDAAAAAAPASDVRWWLSWNQHTFPLSVGDNIIGRDPRCDVWLDHDGVSRRHARIHIEKPSAPAMLADLDSTNGTFIGRQQINAPTPLSDRDVIKLGEVTVQFREWSETAQRTKRIKPRSG